MNKKMLVPLARNDRTEEMIPYIEKVARPETKVVFLVRYPVDGFIWAKEEYGMRTALPARELVKGPSAVTPGRSGKEATTMPS